MTDNVDHVLLTRFNLPSKGFESLVRIKEDWLRDRITLFERYCIPSVQAQTIQAFRWIVYFDPASPEWLKRRIRNHISEKIYVSIFRSSVSTAELTEDIRNATGGHGECLITSNLDNDDALAIDFVERIQKVAPRRDDRTVIYLSHGLIKSESHVYLRVDRTNAFASVAENWTSPSTCWSDWHNLLGRSMPSLKLCQEPGWMQVVHGGNVSNRVRGRLVSPSRFTHQFPGLIDDIHAPSALELVLDTFVSRPRRFVRDSGRTVTKIIAMRLLGKGSLDRVKVLLASRGRR